MHTRVGLRAIRARPAALSRGQTHTRSLALLSSSVSGKQQQLITPPAPHYRLYASSSSAAAQEKAKPATTQSTIVNTPPNDINPDASISTLNPPASTRPPPLDLPARDAYKDYASYLFATGKAYLSFYKTGLKAVFLNRRLVREMEKDVNTRAAKLLRERSRHDSALIPLFALWLLICGELTPLLVVLFPKVTPYTVRIPKQLEKLRRAMAYRRASSFRTLRYIRMDAGRLEKAAPGHILRCLDIGSSFWDKAGMDPPFVRSRASKAVVRIVEDDFMIKEGGGVGALENGEVVIACDERGIVVDIEGENMTELRKRLRQWIMKTTKGSKEEGAATARELLLGDRDEW